MNQTDKYELSFRCVAHLCTLFNNEQNVQESDTIGMTREQKAKYKKIAYNL